MEIEDSILILYCDPALDPTSGFWGPLVSSILETNKI